MMGERDAAGSETLLLWAVAGLFVVVTVAKLLIAGHLNLFYDEALFWQASLRPDTGYVHTRVITPLLVGIGTAIFGDTFFGVRAMHLLLAGALPFAVYLLARPIVGRHDAILAGGLTLVMPFSALQGQASPESSMILVSVLCFAAFAWARRSEGLTPWIILGITFAVGFNTHFRFVPVLMGILAYLLATRAGRRLWTHKGLWIAGLIGLLGLAPMIAFNLSSDFSSLGQHVLHRHPWTFQAKGLRYPVEQMLTVTPFLYAALLATLFVAIRRARAGDNDCALLACYSGVYLGLYLVLGPFQDLKHTYIQWPISGYLPLFVLLPGLLRQFAKAGPSGINRAVRRILTWLVPVSGAAVVLTGIVVLAALAWPQVFYPDLLRHPIRHDLYEWSKMRAPAERYLTRVFPASGKKVVLVASNYQVGSELDFLMKPAEGVFVLTHPENDRPGLTPQIVRWHLDEDSLRRRHPGAPALIALENRPNWFEDAHEAEFRARICKTFVDVRRLGAVELNNGRKQILFLKGQVTSAQELPPQGRGGCPALPPTHISFPRRGKAVAKTVQVRVWVDRERLGVRQMDLLVDGLGGGLSPHKDQKGPAKTLLGGNARKGLTYHLYRYRWDTTKVDDGPHRLSVRLKSADGTIETYGSRTVYVDNR